MQAVSQYLTWKSWLTILGKEFGLVRKLIAAAKRASMTFNFDEETAKPLLGRLISGRNACPV
jgi:hypothetical protein